MEGTELIWALIKDNFEQARSHEEYRARTVGLTLTLGSALVAALALDGFTQKTVTLIGYQFSFQIIDALCMIAVGLFGAICSQKHYERNRMHVALAQHYLKKLQESKQDLLPFDTVEAFEDFRVNGEWKAKRIEWVKLNYLWTGFPLVLVAIGILLLIGS